MNILHSGLTPVEVGRNYTERSGTIGGNSGDSFRVSAGRGEAVHLSPPNRTHFSDLNLAGLATLALLVLFFPCTGLIHRRARAVAARAIDREQKRQLQALLLAEAMRVVSGQAERETHTTSSGRQTR